MVEACSTCCLLEKFGEVGCVGEVATVAGFGGGETTTGFAKVGGVRLAALT